MSYKTFEERSAEIERNIRRTQIAATVVGCGIFLLYLAGICAVGYVVWHFISKFW